MKVLVTGAGGQLGRALRGKPPAGVELVALDRRDLDIADAGAVATRVENEQPDWIVNAAAYTAVDKAESDPENARAVNVTGAANLADAGLRSGCRVLHVSTDFVFDGAQGRPYRPDDEPHPLGIYGQTKLDGEREVLARTALQPVVLRTAWVYDAAGRNFLTTMLRLMRERDSLGVVQDQVGSPTFSWSLARCCWTLVTNDVPGGVYHWTDAGVASWYDFAVAIQEDAIAAGLLGKPVPVQPIRTVDYPTPAKRPHYSVLDRHGIESNGWITARHWRTELREAIAAVRRRGEEGTP